MVNTSKIHGINELKWLTKNYTQAYTDKVKPNNIDIVGESHVAKTLSIELIKRDKKLRLGM